jgi:hypothetical protein
VNIVDEFEKLRQENFAKIVIGREDPNGYTVHGIYVKGEEFAIYSTDVLCSIRGIRVRIDTKTPDNDIPIKNFQAVKGEFDKLKAVSDKCADSSFATRASHALAIAIYGDIVEAKKILAEIYEDIEKTYKERVLGKMSYLSGTFLVAFTICLFSLTLYIFQPETIVRDRTILYQLVLTCSMSTLGGIISVSKGLNSIDIDKGLGRFPYLIYGIERNIFSIVGGIFIFFLIKSNLLFGFINDLENSMFGILIFGFVAGFSETLIPSALTTIEERANKNAA